MILQLAVLLGFLAAGELVVWATGIPVQSSIIGMILLAVSLKIKLVRLEWIDRIADFLVKNLGFFFVPAGVGVMKCFGLISEQWMPIVVASVLSTFVIIAVTGWAHQLTRHALSSSHKKHGHGISGE